MNREGGGRVRRRWGVALAAPLAIAAFVLPASASANVPFQQIQAPGPISDIWLGNELSCQVKLTQDQVYSYFPPNTAPGDCGTFLQVGPPGSPVFAPNFSAHDGTAASNSVWVDWLPVSQTGVGGSGAQTDPFEVTTTVQTGPPTNIRVAERYTYATGSRGYNVDITVTNDNPGSQTVRLFHAIDCFLAGSDVGYGFFDSSTGGIFCTETPNNSPPGRILGFTPTSGSTRYIEDFYDTVWEATDGDYPNTAEPDTFQDNGVGLQWTLSVPGTRAQGRAAETVSYRGTVDSGDALETTILSGPKKKLKTKKKKKKATFTFQASLGGLPLTDATFTCQVDTRAPTACTSPFVTKVKKGKHTFQVQATAQGELDTTPAAQSWKVKRKKKKK
jgi:hypothetical protein